MGIAKATKQYEAWAGQHVPLVKDDLKFKHEQMRTTAFAFFRATFYRWAQVFPKAFEEGAPEVLAVGDLHVENFGTWRDAEGRLIWGVNDFDEAAWLPYTNDLIRLATSVQLAIDENHLKLDIHEACEALLEGYRKNLEGGGKAFVLAEEHEWLRRLATSELRDPDLFWAKMAQLPPLAVTELSSGRTALERALPQPRMAYELRSHRAGLGSLGHPRYVGLADWDGGKIAREAKASLPSALWWASASKEPPEILYSSVVHCAVRSPDPFVFLYGNWLVRRLAPDCSRIELADLPAARDETRLVEAMGREAANIHLGSRDRIDAVRAHLGGQPKKWLRKACGDMAERVGKDFGEYRAQGAKSRVKV